MTIEQTIREHYAGAWYLLFHSAGDRFKFLPTGETISADKYEAIKRNLTPVEQQPAPELTATERQRNNVRAKAEAATRGAGG